MTQRGEKLAERVRALAATFLANESNKTAMITVTGCTVSEDEKYATILISVLPEEKEKEALSFCKRMRAPLRQYVKENLNTYNIPFLETEIDIGEKARRRMDDILRQG